MAAVKIKNPHPYARCLCLALLSSPCLAAEPALAMTETLADITATGETSEETGSNWSARVSEEMVNA